MSDDPCRTYFTRDTITDVFDAAEWLRRLRDHFAFMVEQASDSSGDHVARDSWVRWRDLLDKAAGETHACGRQMLRMPPDLSMYVACVAHPIRGHDYLAEQPL